MSRHALANTMSRAVGCVAPFCAMTVDVALQSTSYFNASSLDSMETTEQLRIASSPSHESAAFMQSSQLLQLDREAPLSFKRFQSYLHNPSSRRGRMAALAQQEELKQRPASASTSFEKLREFVPAPGASNGVGHGDDSVWLPNGAQRRQRRKYQDVVNHEKTLVDRVTDKDERIDSLVKERDARIGELEAEAKKLETKTKRMELAKTNEMVKERKLENDLIDSQKAQVSSEAQADDLRAQMEALQAHKAVTVSPGDEALASAIDQKLEAIQGQTEAAVKSALDVAAKATSQVDKLVAGAIARDKANELRTADSEASDGKADAVESSTKADELLRQMEANAERAAQKAKKLREKAELSESLKARKHDELKKLEALEAKAARKAKRAENDERASAADAWKAMSESAKIRKDTAHLCDSLASESMVVCPNICARGQASQANP